MANVANRVGLLKKKKKAKVAHSPSEAPASSAPSTEKEPLDKLEKPVVENVPIVASAA
jgi:hypothetical protein